MLFYKQNISFKNFYIYLFSFIYCVCMCGAVDNLRKLVLSMGPRDLTQVIKFHGKFLYSPPPPYPELSPQLTRKNFTCVYFACKFLAKAFTGANSLCGFQRLLSQTVEE